MSPDIIVIIIFSVMGLAAHGARHHQWMESTLRVVYSIAFVAEMWTAFVVMPARGSEATPWSIGVTATMAVLTGAMLFKPFRQLISAVLTFANNLITGQAFLVLTRPQAALVPAAIPAAATAPALPKPTEASDAAPATSEPATAESVTQVPASEAEPAEIAQTADAQPESAPTEDASAAVTPTEPTPAAAPPEAAPVEVAPAAVKPINPIANLFLWQRVFVADSIPHLNGLWIYVTVLGSLLANINPENFGAPSVGIPFPVPLDSLFSYNFLGLIILAAAGCGVFVARQPGELLVRLGIVKPKGWHVGLALLLVPFTFFYDWAWREFTGQGVGNNLSTYNAGTFTAGGGSAGPSAFLALATGVCAGFGEEVLMRGGLQPVFGIIPAGILHGALHGQFQHMPIIIVQLGIWSCIMGVVRKYTNTTTTIITHVTFNFLTTFLFAFNPS